MSNTTRYTLSIPELRQALERILPDGHPGVAQVATEMGVSVRTLQRRLTQAGLCHSVVVQQVRLSRACQLLSCPQIAVCQIARATGFATPSTFSRAFHHWTGVSPREFRRNLNLAQNVK